MNILTSMVLPSGVAYGLFLLGLLTRFWTRTKACSWWLLAGSGAIMVVFSSGMVAAALLSPLEYSYPTVHSPNSHPGVRNIVVLTGYAADDHDMPLSGRLHYSSAYRVLLALEFYRDCEDCRIIVSGNRITARIMGELLVKLGVPPGRLVIEGESASTSESALHVRDMLGRDPFFLITSAGHMPRAVAAMDRAGLTAVAAPTDHQLPRNWRRAELQPRPLSLTASDLAVHEVLGRLWHRIRYGSGET